MSAVSVDRAATSSLLDALMPEYEHFERHETLINASHDVVWSAIREVTPREIPVLLVLTAVRGLRCRPRRDLERPLLDIARSGGFFDIGKADDEMVLGTIGQFWRLRPRERQQRVDGAESFKAWSEPGFAKAAINFRTETEGANTRLITETRIATSDPQTRRRFAWYWRLIYPGSAWIRRAWLKAIRHRAELSPER